MASKNILSEEFSLSIQDGCQLGTWYSTSSVKLQAEKIFVRITTDLNFYNAYGIAKQQLFLPKEFHHHRYTSYWSTTPNLRKTSLFFTRFSSFWNLTQPLKQHINLSEMWQSQYVGLKISLFIPDFPYKRSLKSGTNTEKFNPLNMWCSQITNQRNHRLANSMFSAEGFAALALPCGHPCMYCGLSCCTQGLDSFLPAIRKDEKHDESYTNVLIGVKYNPHSQSYNLKAASIQITRVTSHYHRWANTDRLGLVSDKCHTPSGNRQHLYSYLIQPINAICNLIQPYSFQ